MIRWAAILQDGREFSDTDTQPWAVPFDSPLSVIAQPCCIREDGTYSAQPILVNYTHHLYRTDLVDAYGELGIWVGHESDSDVVRALTYYAPHIVAVRSSLTDQTANFNALWQRGRELCGMKP